MIKKIFSTILAFGILATSAAVAESRNTPEKMKTIQLETPDMNVPVLKALKNRQTRREFADRMLSQKDLSNLLWAAYGVNREDGRHTAASALNKQDVDVYVFTADGAYKYVPASSTLQPVAAGDHRALIRGFQADFPLPPVTLVLTTTPSRFEVPDAERSLVMGCVDVGLVAQNAMVYAAAADLAIVPRASMDAEGIHKLLGIPAETQVILNLPVGYPVGK